MNLSAARKARNPKPMLDARRLAFFRRQLIHWYDKNRRDLPWRRSKDPYSIWISEMMLQQTRVEAVIPYYERFLKRYPTAKELAQSSQDDVLSLWSGLGYYQRARNLHSAAKEMLARYHGQVPQDYESIRALPGIGPYSAGAILSIAYEKRVPLLDGNVIRLFSRLLCLKGDPSEKRNREKFWALAELVLPKSRLGDFNQALMELPALICTPRSPQCGVCPLQRICQAYSSGQQERFPQKKKKPTPRNVSLAYACVNQAEKVYLLQRQSSPMKGMWEFPSVEALRKQRRQEQGIQFGPLRHIGTAKHAIMNERITAKYFQTQGEGGSSERVWFSREQIESMPLTTLTRKGLQLLATIRF